MIWLRAVVVSVGAAVVSGWCTAGALIVGFTKPSDKASLLTDRGALADVLFAAGLASIAPAALGGLLGGLLAGRAKARRERRSRVAWCLKGAVLGFSLGCAIALLYGAALGAASPELGVFGVPGAVAGSITGTVVGLWCSRTAGHLVENDPLT